VSPDLSETIRPLSARVSWRHSNVVQSSAFRLSLNSSGDRGYLTGSTDTGIGIGLEKISSLCRTPEADDAVFRGERRRQAAADTEEEFG